jgi:proteasome lid subunit RPN8/RPN11
LADGSQNLGAHTDDAGGLVIAGWDREAVRAHGEETYPQECCGFLLGTGAGNRKQVVRVVRAANERPDSAENRYLISPEAYLRVEHEAARAGLDIVGFYHSHPEAPARPSEFDRAHALPWCSYVIVSVRGGKARELASWVLSEDYTRFLPEPIADPEPGAAEEKGA